MRRKAMDPLVDSIALTAYSTAAVRCCLGRSGTVGIGFGLEGNFFQGGGLGLGGGAAVEQSSAGPGEWSRSGKARRRIAFMAVVYWGRGPQISAIRAKSSGSACCSSPATKGKKSLEPK